MLDVSPSEWYILELEGETRLWNETVGDLSVTQAFRTNEFMHCYIPFCRSILGRSQKTVRGGRGGALPPRICPGLVDTLSPRNFKLVVWAQIPVPVPASQTREDEAIARGSKTQDTIDASSCSKAIETPGDLIRREIPEVRHWHTMVAPSEPRMACSGAKNGGTVQGAEPSSVALRRYAKNEPPGERLAKYRSQPTRRKYSKIAKGDRNGLISHMESPVPTSPSSLATSSTPLSFKTPTPSPAPFQYPEPPDEFVQDNITYLNREKTTKKAARLGSSHVWKYGLRYIRDSDKKEVYYCHECAAGKHKQELFIINGTSGVRNHLEQKHQIDPQSGIKKPSRTRKSVLEQQRSAAATNTFFWKDSIEKFKELLVRWIVYCHIAFFQFENQYFRELLFFLNPALLSHLPKAAKTIRSWVMDAFRSKKQRLREDLRQARSRISISFDLWTSPNPYAVLGVIAMWIDTAGKRQTTVLGIRRVYGEHTGENIGSAILELLREYDVGGDQIGYFMLDNASSNDTAVEFILKELCPWMTPKQRRHRRLRCLGHIINLCCQAFLMGRDCERYLAKLEKHYQRGDYAKVEELWKRFGCLGRLHNLVRYIRLTPQRREEFAAIIVGGDLAEFDRLELIQNNSTRWNSWFHSITRALNVRERLEIFSARHVPGKGSHGIANFKLDGQHWFELEKIELALKD
ncbi:54S ribosomal protein L4, partial [Fusarium oxysporum f. sp. albedinis]